MDIQFEGGKSAFVRVLVWRADEAEGSVKSWNCSKLYAELGILRWLEANASSLPVPRILAFDDVNCLLVTTVMPGMDVLHAYPRLSTAAKEHSVISWAHAAVFMFRLPTPQRFGTIENPLYLYVSPQHTFATDNTADLLSFFQSAISARRTRSLMTNNAEAHEILCCRLDRLLYGMKPLVVQAQNTPSMSRFALTHRDLGPANIMLDEASGEVVGIVDWEFNACMPACMSTEYPLWIRPIIIASPLYQDPNPKYLNFFHEPRAERNRLCELYEKTVKELDEDYYNCLLYGTRLRDALEWIEGDHTEDTNGVRMVRWAEDHLFSSVAVKF
ncbi:hypothetical protein B0H17DRAFT_1202476 [Mycena rosella]|uniref:Aminoglycoside phosphotransferase domain-containing protein n=1 Tax=Mycena rosella TaxID=1033263 RepID=A0AAD7DDH8_MYCRO|nr:hypothetical protein B0H17DRAFT_1202476 [Mycena rosella]